VLRLGTICKGGQRFTPQNDDWHAAEILSTGTGTTRGRKLYIDCYHLGVILESVSKSESIHVTGYGVWSLQYYGVVHFSLQTQGYPYCSLQTELKTENVEESNNIDFRFKFHKLNLPDQAVRKMSIKFIILWGAQLGLPYKARLSYTEVLNGLRSERSNFQACTECVVLEYIRALHEYFYRIQPNV
jgi:hypothetical protein